MRCISAKCTQARITSECYCPEFRATMEQTSISVTQTDIPEICHCSRGTAINVINIAQISEKKNQTIQVQ